MAEVLCLRMGLLSDMEQQPSKSVLQGWFYFQSVSTLTSCSQHFGFMTRKKKKESSVIIRSHPRRWKVGESCPKKHVWSFAAKQRRLQPDWLDTTTPPSRTRRIRDVQYLSEWKRFGSQLMTYPGD